MEKSIRGRYGYKEYVHGEIGKIVGLKFGRYDIPLIYFYKPGANPDKDYPSRWVPTIDIAAPWSWLEYDGERYETREDYDSLQVRLEREKIGKMLEEM